MSTQSSAFNFTRDFSNAKSSPYLDGNGRLPVPFAQHAAELEAARSEGYARGVTEGREAQRDEESARIAAALEQIAQTMAVGFGQLDAIEAKARTEALDFAKVFAGKIAGRLIEQAPIVPIEMAMRAILNDLRGAAHVAVRVAPSTVDACKNRLTLLLRENGLEPRLHVFPDPDVAAGDCRIEWADGGIVREREKLEYLIEKSVDVILAR